MSQFRGVGGDPQIVDHLDQASSSGDLDAGSGGVVDSLVVSARQGAINEVLIVDPGIDDAPILVDGRRAGIEIVHLSSGGRGLEQIAGHLGGLHDIATVHLVCHGEPGVLVLAGDRIDLPALAMRRAVLADMAKAFRPGGIVALYGCSVAAGAAGLQFLDYFEAALGVGVAASAGPVGAAALGGRWTLRNRYGAPVETAFSPLTRATYPALLTTMR